MFKVVADQLKISEGWVRCGHCADVFDATLYLQPWVPPAQEGAPGDLAAAAPAPEPEPLSAQTFDAELEAELEAQFQRPPQAVDEPEPSDAIPARAAAADASDLALARSVESLPPAAIEAPSAQAGSDDQESDFHAELERFAAGLGRLKAEVDNTDAVAVAEQEAVAPDIAAMPAAPVPADLGDPGVARRDDLDAPEPVPGFVRQAQRQAFWQSRGVRVVLSLLALMLVLLLAGQWALQERDRLAAWQPGLKPWLQRACKPLDCVVAPVRRIDAIVIDSTSLVRRLGNFYAFDLVLKNTASVALAVPALELSLTDISDQVISRRVFLPEEWPDTPALLPANGSVNVSFRLSLALGDSTPMAGYRALVFYP
jgi:predicted Zn finger-like uncharacterized protein